MLKAFLILVAFFSSLAHAGDFSKFYNYCVIKKNGKFNYTLDRVPEINRKLYTSSGVFDDVLNSVVVGAIRGSSRIYDEFINAVSNQHQGKKIRAQVIQTLKEQIYFHRLNSFEKAKIVNCAVFWLIDYKENRSTKLGSILDIYEKGEGICTEMTDIARDLGTAVGLRVRSVISNESHNWPEYKLDGTWYILDPTVSGAYFLEALKQ